MTIKGLSPESLQVPPVDLFATLSPDVSRDSGAEDCGWPERNRKSFLFVGSLGKDGYGPGTASFPCRFKKAEYCSMNLSAWAVSVAMFCEAWCDWSGKRTYRDILD